MSLLAFDLIKMEANLIKQINEKLKPTKWDVRSSYVVEKDMRAWNKMMGTGKTNKTVSTRKCLDAKRRLDDYLQEGGSDGKGIGKGFMGSKTLIGVRL